MVVWTLRVMVATVTLRTTVSKFQMESTPKWSSRKRSLEITRARCSWRKEKMSRMNLMMNTRKTTMMTESKSTCNKTKENPSKTTWSQLEETTKGRNESISVRRIVTVEVMLRVSCSGEVSCGFSCLLAFFAWSLQGGNADEALLLINCPTSSAFARFS